MSAHIYTVKEIAEIGECVRKWACKRLHRLPDPKHPAAEAGIQMHAVLERMLREGPQANTDPESEVGSWARALYPLAPPGCHAELAQNFELEFPRAGAPPERYASSFKIDFVFPDFSGFGDWKSCAGAKYALAGPDATEQQQQDALANDLQANLEAYGFMKITGRNCVALHWAYVDKKTRKSWSVRGYRFIADAAKWLEAHALPRIRLIEAMRALDPKPEIRAVPHDLTACGGSGRFCAFLGACQFQPSSAGLTTEALYQLVK